MKRLGHGQRASARRLKTELLDMLDHRIRLCREAEARYAALAQLPDGGHLGSVAIAKLSEATERSARFEAELIRQHVASIRVSGESA